jgi:hypothetical protein
MEWDLRQNARQQIIVIEVGINRAGAAIGAIEKTNHRTIRGGDGIHGWRIRDA